jgi:hypothetical protein
MLLRLDRMEETIGIIIGEADGEIFPQKLKNCPGGIHLSRMM